MVNMNINSDFDNLINKGKNNPSKLKTVSRGVVELTNSKTKTSSSSKNVNQYKYQSDLDKLVKKANNHSTKNVTSTTGSNANTKSKTTTSNSTTTTAKKTTSSNKKTTSSNKKTKKQAISQKKGNASKGTLKHGVSNAVESSASKIVKTNKILNSKNRNVSGELSRRIENLRSVIKLINDEFDKKETLIGKEPQSGTPEAEAWGKKNNELKRQCDKFKYNLDKLEKDISRIERVIKVYPSLFRIALDLDYSFETSNSRYNEIVYDLKDIDKYNDELYELINTLLNKIYKLKNSNPK